MGTAGAFGGISGRLRLAQNGFVRSYALGLLGGAALVLLALVVVNSSGIERCLPWLTILLLLPIVGSLVLVVLPARAATAAPKQIALGFSLLTLVLGVVLAIGYEPGGGMDYSEDVDWIKLFGAHYALGLDGIGLALVLLTVILTPVVILASWNDGDLGRWGAKGFFAWILALEGLSIGVFAATDVFLFYVFFEATLIPVYFLVAGYGGPDRVRRGGEVPALLAVRRAGHARLGDRALRRVGEDRGRSDVPHLRAVPDRLRHRGRPLDVPRLLHRLRDQGADVPGAHLAARHHGRARPPAPRCCWSACSTRSAPSG